MLKTLRRIVQEVNAAQDLSEVLTITVRRIKEAMKTQACSIFLIDPLKKQYVLMATEGLNPAVIRKVRLDLNHGLVGLVGQREEPINLDDAQNHPHYLHSTEVGEERFNAFLGVPIIYHRRLLGVLIIQQEQQRRYDELEESFLVTISAQLASVISHA